MEALKERDLDLLKTPWYGGSLLVLVEAAHFDGDTTINKEVGRNVPVWFVDQIREPA
jgi:hypothetical protein